MNSLEMVFLGIIFPIVASAYFLVEPAFGDGEGRRGFFVSIIIGYIAVVVFWCFMAYNSESEEFRQYSFYGIIGMVATVLRAIMLIINCKYPDR